MIPSDQLQQLQQQGYCVLKSLIDPAQVAALQAECCDHLAEMKAEMDARNAVVFGLSHRYRRYFIDGRYTDHPGLVDFLFGPIMAAITQAILGDDVYLIRQYFTVKAARWGMEFGWHQDSGYISEPHSLFLSCWCTLDDVTEDNGTLFVLPNHRSGTTGLLPHRREQKTGDLLAYFGNDPGIPIVAPAGSVVLLSNLTLHRSGVNHTRQPRRVYLVQYARQPIGTQAVPFLKNGQIVNQILCPT